jgi:hypothetical protein
MITLCSERSYTGESYNNDGLPMDPERCVTTVRREEVGVGNRGYKMNSIDLTMGMEMEMEDRDRFDLSEMNERIGNRYGFCDYMIDASTDVEDATTDE